MHSIPSVESVLEPGVRAARRAQRRQWSASGGYSKRTIASVIEDGARTHPDTVVVFDSETHASVTSLGAIRGDAEQAAAGYHALGLRAGDVIAVQVPNWPEAAVAYAAAALLGLVVVPIVHIYRATEVEFIVKQSGARALVVPSQWGAIDYGDHIAGLGDAPHLRHIISIGGPLVGATVTWDDILARGSGLDYPTSMQSPGDVAVIVYTSGTTAEPKGVLHTHDSFVAELNQSPTPPSGRAGTPTLQPFPAGHTAGLVALLAPWAHGGTTVLMDNWRTETAMDLIDRYGVRSMAGTPFHITSLLDLLESERRTPPPALQDVMTGGAGVPSALVERGDAAGWCVVRCYGSTEHPSMVACSSADTLDVRAVRDGRALNGARIQVVDGEGQQLPCGREGEVVAIGPEQFLGYTDPAFTATAFTPTGWFQTGDIGVLDAGGYLTITDRKKDIIIRGGENISSREVEDVLLRHPRVSDVAVVPSPDPRYGELVHAFVVLRGTTHLSLEEVRAHFQAAGVAKQKTPEGVTVVDEFPRTPAGKVKKYDLRSRLGPPDSSVAGAEMSG